MSAINQRDKALSVLDSKLAQLSMGRGALLVYASDVIEKRFPTNQDYRKKEEILDIFDAPASHNKLEKMIDKYDHKNEGIMTLITSLRMLRILLR